jgi:CheY-like chemotaxis protein
MNSNYSARDYAATNSSTSTRPTDQVTFAPRRGAILVVEDRDDVRQGLGQLLELHGYLVEDATSGDQALQQLTSEPDGFALILLDLMLPGATSGRDVRMRQLADPALSAIPTIVVTGTDMDARDRLGLRPEAWLDKPYRFDELLALIKKYVVSEGSALQADD